MKGLSRGLGIILPICEIWYISFFLQMHKKCVSSLPHFEKKKKKEKEKKAQRIVHRLPERNCRPKSAAL